MFKLGLSDVEIGGGEEVIGRVHHHARYSAWGPFVEHAYVQTMALQS